MLDGSTWTDASREALPPPNSSTSVRSDVCPARASPTTTTCASGREVALHLGRHLAVVERADDVGDDVGDGTAGPQEMADLGLPMRPQRHHGDRADAVQREVDRDELDRVRQLHDDAIAGAQAACEEGRGQRVDLGDQVAIGQPAVGRDDRDPVGNARRRPRDHRGDVDAFPQAGLAIRSGDVVGPARERVVHRSARRQPATNASGWRRSYASASAGSRLRTSA